MENVLFYLIFNFLFYSLVYSSYFQEEIQDNEKKKGWKCKEGDLAFKLCINIVHGNRKRQLSIFSY